MNKHADTTDLHRPTIPRTTRTRLRAAAALIVGLALAGCGSDTPPTAETSAAETSAVESSTAETSAAAPGSGAADSAATGTAELAVAPSDLGDIVVDGKGMTVYLFDKDEQGSGASSCAGECATNWPAVTTTSSSPTVDGVTGEVGTITGTDGTTQLTLDGWPLYYYIGDQQAGDLTGQAVGGVWWVLAADGSKITATGTVSSGGDGY